MKTGCDREIGSPVKGWSRCGAAAAYEITSKGSHAISILCACNRHLDAMQRSDASFRLVSVRPLVRS